jgi:hypothetical protein
MRSIVIFSLLLAAALAAANAEDPRAVPPPGAITKTEHEVRQHFRVTSIGAIDEYTVTRIGRLSELRDEEIILIQTKSGDRFAFTRDARYDNQRSIYELRDIDRKEFIRLELKKPFDAKTRSATIEEARKNPKLLDVDLPFEITTTGNGSVTGFLSHKADVDTVREWRITIRRMLSGSFIDSMELMQTSGLLSIPLLNGADKILADFVLYRTECPARLTVETMPALADCRFDAKMGYPCSDKQDERAARAAVKTEAKPY